jgi:LmbE family N-acetylglucosaminyl deacetylase
VIGECFADVTHTIDAKLEAIAAHESQIAKS